MSYSNGLGSLQQLLGTTDVAGTNSTTSTSKTSANAATSGPTRSGVAGAVSIGGDKASLSSAGSLLVQTLLGSDVRTGKVAALQQQIAAGAYNVSSSNVASNLIDAMM